MDFIELNIIFFFDWDVVLFKIKDIVNILFFYDFVIF